MILTNLYVSLRVGPLFQTKLSYIYFYGNPEEGVTYFI